MAPGPCRTALTFLAASLSLTGCGQPGAKTPVPRQAQVERRDVEDVFLLTGELTATRSASLTVPRIEGGRAILRWLAEDGVEVEEGERVAELDPTSLIQRLEERRQRLRQAQLNRESLERSAEAESERRRAAVDKAEIEDQKSRMEASVPLEYRDPKDRLALQAKWQQTRAALEKAQLDQQAQRVTSRADITAARSTEEKARRELLTTEEALGRISLRAPRSGIFLVGMNFNQWGPDGPRRLQPGDSLWAGSVVGTVPDPDEMEVQAKLAEADHGRVLAGMGVRCVLDTYPDRSFAGSVAEVGSVASAAFQNSVSSGRAGFPVRVSLERTDPLMRPGLSVRVEVVRHRWTQALAVPRGAVRLGTGGPAAQRDGVQIPVKLAGCTPVDCVVESGLREGDRVTLF